MCLWETPPHCFSSWLHCYQIVSLNSILKTSREFAFHWFLNYNLNILNFRLPWKRCQRPCSGFWQVKRRHCTSKHKQIDEICKQIKGISRKKERKHWNYRKRITRRDKEELSYLQKKYPRKKNLVTYTNKQKMLLLLHLKKEIIFHHPLANKPKKMILST